MWNSLMVCGLCKSLGRGTPSLSKLRIGPAIDHGLPPAGKTSAHPGGVLTAPIGSFGVTSGPCLWNAHPVVFIDQRELGP